MFLFLLPYSRLQRKLVFKNCDDSRFTLEEFEPLARSIEKEFVKDYSLAPLYRRFRNVFWESLELWVLPPPVVRYIEENSWVLSPLYGLVKPTACIPFAPVSWKEFYGEKTLMDFWKEHIRNLSKKLLSEKVVVSFVGKPYEKLFDLKHAKGFLSVEYYRKDQRVKLPYKHYAYTLRYIAEKNLSLSELEKINFYDYKVESVKSLCNKTLVVMRSEGRYEI